MQLLFAQPVLTTTYAHLISLTCGVAYVGSLYLSQNARLSFVSHPAGTHEGNGENPRQKLKDERWRDDPDVIRARMVAVAFATVACCLGVFCVLWIHVKEEASLLTLLFGQDLTGFQHQDVSHVLKATLFRLGVLPPLFNPQLFSISSYSAHFVTPVLFLGPLFGAFLGGQLPGQRGWRWQTQVVPRIFGIQGIRNYLVVSIFRQI